MSENTVRLRKNLRHAPGVRYNPKKTNSTTKGNFMIKAIFVTVSLLAAQTSLAMGFDGCFHMHTEGASAPVFCLSGTMEEGIGGSNAKIAMFRTNTDTPSHCFKTSGLRVDFDQNQLEVDINGRLEMTMKIQSTTAKGLRQGTTLTGKTKMYFLELDQKTTTRFYKNLQQSRLCN